MIELSLSRPGRSGPPSIPTRPLERSFRRSSCPPISASRGSKGSGATIIAEAEIQPATNWEMRSPRSRAALARSSRPPEWRPSHSSLHAVLEPGDRLLVPHDCYGGSYRLFTALAAKGAFEIEICDFTDTPSLEAAIARKPKLIWVETPSNPLLRITDLALVLAPARKAGALVAADNTFLSPALQRPIEHGADIVIHSTTKYINGHSDIVGGAAIARDPAMLEQLQWWANALGLTGAPFDSYLTLRGLRTLEARLRIQQDNCASIAELLAGDPHVAAVHYPGLPSHPGHVLAARQQDGFGAMLSFDLQGGYEAVQRFTADLSCITVAESLGGVESLIAYPVTMSHAALSEQERARAGIGEGLLRLSVGIENVEDLIADIREALLRIADAR